MDNPQSRVANEMPPHSYIKSISFDGGKLSGQTIHFSPELNTLIGIRGSGKSAVLEVLRYVLDIPLGDKAGDPQYKQELVGYVMGSGGKAVIQAIDRYGQSYEIRRVWKENSSVYIDGIVQPGISIRETVLHKPIYFGQKDLSNTGEGFEKDLVEKLLGQKLDGIRRQIATQKAKVVAAVEQLKKLHRLSEQIEEQTKIKQDTEHRLRLYDKYGMKGKLQKRLDFDADIRALHQSTTRVGEFVLGLKEVLAQYEDDIRDFMGYQSKYNADLIADLVQVFTWDYATVIGSLDRIKSEIDQIEKTKLNLSATHTQLNSIRQGLVDEFAQVERQLAAELQTNAGQNISSDEFLRLKHKLAQTTQSLNTLVKQSEQRDSAASTLVAELDILNRFWHEEFTLIKGELDQVKDQSASLAIDSRYKEDKAGFLRFIKDNFKGSSIRDASFQKLAEQYPDFIAIYQDFDNAKKLLGANSQALAFEEYFEKNLATLLTYQTPNPFVMTYHGKELQHHSLGQRASALILFVLSQQENDVIIIDQPEDDLDNQTLYEDVIKLIRQMKPKIQFIFATHNPNIPVLGDAEQISVCRFVDDRIAIQSGGIDEPAQQKAIVEIMEGGREAFNRRKEIYTTWIP